MDAALDARDKRLRRLYGISSLEYDKILAHQGGVCALCEELRTQSGKNKGKPKPLGVDHDHKSGLTRGILCFGCNRRLPEWMTVEWLEEALAYMKDPPASEALGGHRYGRKGRITNKRKRRRTVKRKRS